MVDLHTHSLLSDGSLLPAELVRRAAVLGMKAIAITDHGDHSNIELIIPQIVRASEELSEANGIVVVPGVELTHLPPKLIAPLVRRSRELGAKLVLVHGETFVEPVIPGTNRAAIEGEADILVHPGLISEEDVILARERGVYLELTARKGHCLANGWVAKLALRHRAKLVINSDAHDPGDLITPERAREVALGAGLSEVQYEEVKSHTLKLVKCLKGSWPEKSLKSPTSS